MYHCSKHNELKILCFPFCNITINHLFVLQLSNIHLNSNQKSVSSKRKRQNSPSVFSRTIILDPKLILIHFASPLRFSIFVVGMWLQWSVVNFYQKWNFPPCVLNWVKNRLNYFASWPLFSNSCSTSRFDWKMRFLVIWPQKRKCWFDFRTSTHATLKKQQHKIWKTQ